MVKRQKFRRKSQQSKSLPTLLLENRARKKGYRCVAGLDEAGRGPLAGPVTAACVVLKRTDFTAKIDDSKRLSASSREKAYSQIIERADVGIGVVFEDTIEDINISNATTLAMRKAFFSLPIKPDILLIDGKINLNLPLKQVSIIRGDRKSLSIAAASIVAKVIRDRLMIFYDMIFPRWGLKKHKGYGTKAHINLIKRHGLSPLHRRSFVKWLSQNRLHK